MKFREMFISFHFLLILIITACLRVLGERGGGGGGWSDFVGGGETPEVTMKEYLSYSHYYHSYNLNSLWFI